MKSRSSLSLILPVSLFVLLCPLASADTISYYAQGGILPNAPAYLWWYGCSPTSAGMMMGFYDINGFDGLTYDNLVPGGIAELTSGPLANAAIASSGHIADFWTGYGNTGDPLSQHHSFDSLADFMGTSQDSAGNSDGSTTFYYRPDGSKWTASDSEAYGVWNRDGLYGLWEYMDYTGYDVDKADFFTQLTDNQNANGFSFADYMATIDDGRVVMLQVEGHSMFGYGYDGPSNTVYLHDTWDFAEHTMTWGGEYDGRDMWGVTVLTPSGGEAPTTVPEPGTILLLGSGILVIVALNKKPHL